MVRKFRIKTRQEPIRANSKSCSFMSSVKGHRWPYPSNLTACNISLSLSLAPLPAWNSPWLMSHSSGISNILGLSPQRFMKWSCFAEGRQPHVAWPKQLSEALEEESRAFSLASFMHLKSAQCEGHCQAWRPSWDGPWPIHHLSSNVFVQLLPSYREVWMLSFTNWKLTYRYKMCISIQWNIIYR